MTANGEDQITLPMPWGGQVVARGALIILVLLIFAGGYLTWLIHVEETADHREIIAGQVKAAESIVQAMNYQSCLTKLNLFVMTSKDPTRVAINLMPTELWSCMPRFLTEEQQAERKLREGSR